MKKEYMRDYTLRGGKDAAIMNRRQAMGEAQHNYKNSFVKEEQAKMQKHTGKAPMMEERYMKFDACMVSNGAHAQAFAKELTRSIDHDAFPIRQNVDESQD